MTAKLWELGTSNAFSTTLNGTITDTTATIALTSVTGLQYPGLIVVDRQDSNSVDTPTTREYISYTGISGSSLTGCTRGLGGSTAQAHNSGAKVEEVFSVTHWGDSVDFLLVEHGTDGTHSSLVALAGAQTITGAKTFTTGLLKAIDITSGAGVNTLPTSSDTLVGRATTDTLTNKRITPRVVTATDDATAVIDVDVTDQYQLTAVANATTFTVSGTPTAGQKLIVRLTDAGVAKGLTWTGFTAKGATPPTTTVAGKTHYVGFIYNATASTWDCVAAIVEA